SKGLADSRLLAGGVAVITIPDIRWARPDIKSVSLLPNVLGKQQAKRAGAYEAWQVGRDGHVTEGTSSNAWIVMRSGGVATHPADRSILNGVTRQGVLGLLARERIALEERAFTVAEAKAASECFLTSASNFILPVVRIDDAPVAGGAVGAVTRRIAAAYAAYAKLGGQDR
ncbi:MAG: aminotransferase class IV, partial [Stellaceae bacterium]